MVIGGAIGGGAAAAFMTPWSGGDLGDNIVAGATQGAFFAAISMGFSRTNPVSQAAAHGVSVSPLDDQALDFGEPSVCPRRSPS
jgi:hypothetical protein